MARTNWSHCAKSTKSPPNFGGLFGSDSFESGGRVHGVCGLVEGVLDLGTQESENADNNECDERNQEAVLDEGLALFFLQKLFDHDDVSVFPVKFAQHRVFRLESVRCLPPALAPLVFSTLLIFM